RGTVHQVLTNEKYIGNNVYHRTSFKLKRKHVLNPPDRWIRADGVFDGIIEPEIFLRARSIILARSQKFTDVEMLETLRTLLAQHGQLSGIIIDEADGVPSSAAFRHRFGSLVSAYRLIGYDPEIDFAFIEINRKLRQRHPEIVASVIRQIEALGASADWDHATHLLNLNNELRISIVLCRHITTTSGSSRWMIRLDAGLKPDLTIAVRMDATNDNIRDYYLLPAIDLTWENLRLAEHNGLHLDAYRFDTLEYFFGMAERVKLQEAT
ncbi:MAG: recombinase family protein, partial [Verrucomicrobiota bacterium]